MAVPSCERKEGRFSLAIEAERLARYTIQITANEKVFVPEYRRAITDDIVTSAKNIYLSIMEANDVKVRMDTPHQMADWLLRRRHQQEALRNAKRLLRLMDLAHRLFHLSSKRVKYWGEMVCGVKNRIQGWMESDKERYTPKG